MSEGRGLGLRLVFEVVVASWTSGPGQGPQHRSTAAPTCGPSHPEPTWRKFCIFPSPAGMPSFLEQAPSAVERLFQAFRSTHWKTLVAYAFLKPAPRF